MLPVYAPEPTLDTPIVASLGDYTLLRISDTQYELHGPDNRCPTDWIQSHLPPASWWTQWGGSGDHLILSISC